MPVFSRRTGQNADQIFCLAPFAAGISRPARKNARGIHDLLRKPAAASQGGRADERPAGAEAHGAGAFIRELPERLQDWPGRPCDAAYEAFSGAFAGGLLRRKAVLSVRLFGFYRRAAGNSGRNFTAGGRDGVSLRAGAGGFCVYGGRADSQDAFAHGSAAQYRSCTASAADAHRPAAGAFLLAGPCAGKRSGPVRFTRAGGFRRADENVRAGVRAGGGPGAEADSCGRSLAGHCRCVHVGRLSSDAFAHARSGGHRRVFCRNGRYPAKAAAAGRFIRDAGGKQVCV